MKSENFDKPVFEFINTLCNFIALNVVFLLTCLPVITIGTALSSLYAVTLREAKGEYGYLVRTYLKEFKQNLKPGTIAFLILAAAGAVLLFGIVFWFSGDSVVSYVLCTLLCITFAAWFLTVTYTFPLIARFENTTRQTLKNAFALAISNLKITLALILIDAVILCLCYVWDQMKILMVLFGFAFIAYCRSFLFQKVFDPYENEEKE